MSKWAIELGQFDVKFLPKVAIKGQVLAEFVAKFLPRTMSPKMGNHTSAQREEDKWTRTSTMIDLTLEGLEVCKELEGRA